MAVSLTKGGKVNLTKEAGGTLKELVIGLGWDAKSGNVSGADFDLDASAFVLDASGKVLSEEWFIFFNNLASPDGTVSHSGDNLTGAGDGDDEAITIKLAELPATADRIVISVTIFEADSRKQNFGMLENAYAHALDASNSGELARYDLDMDFSMDTAVVFCEVARRGSDWVFKAVGNGYPAGLEGLVKDFGLAVG